MLSAAQVAPHTLQRGSLPAARMPVAVRAAAYQTAAEPPPSSVPFKPRVFADYSIYKGKGALSLKVGILEQHTCPDLSELWNIGFQLFAYFGQTFCVNWQAIRPEWKETGNADIGINRTGSMFLEFAPSDQSAAQNGFGERRYEWTKKQVSCMFLEPVDECLRRLHNDVIVLSLSAACCDVQLQTFALSPTEMAGFIVQDNFSMIHDPSKGKQ
jgi:Whirly transcription factor